MLSSQLADGPTDCDAVSGATYRSGNGVGPNNNVGGGLVNVQLGDMPGVGAPLLDTWRERIETSATPGCFPVALAINFAVQKLSSRQAFVVQMVDDRADLANAIASSNDFRSPFPGAACFMEITNAIHSP